MSHSLEITRKARDLLGAQTKLHPQLMIEQIALDQAADWFLAYAMAHKEKAQRAAADGDLARAEEAAGKEATNRIRAVYCKTALQRAEHLAQESTTQIGLQNVRNELLAFSRNKPASDYERGYKAALETVLKEHFAVACSEEG